jgi:hypothetical protein
MHLAVYSVERHEQTALVWQAQVLALNGELGWKKTIIYVILVVVLSTFAGWIFGLMA